MLSGAISRFLVILESLVMSSGSRYWSWADLPKEFDAASFARLSLTSIAGPASRAAKGNQIAALNCLVLGVHVDGGMRERLVLPNP